MLKLQLNDPTVYVDLDGKLVYGTVVEVIQWTGGKKGFTYYVRHESGSTGEFRSDDKHLFKKGAKIPRKILEEHLTPEESEDETDD